MKKFARTLLLCLLLCALALSAVACGGVSFSVKEGFANPNQKAVNDKTGGFVTETQDYFYVINGATNSADDNEFGKPQGKGTLIAIKKADMSSSVVVPKLLVSSDYNAGVYIFDGRAYFATPSTDKKLSGATKNDNLVFASCKLDGTDYVEYATVSSLSTTFRFVKSGEVVYVVYYDNDSKALIEYNTKTQVSATIAQTNDIDLEVLAEYKFFDNGYLDKGVVAYTTSNYKKGTEKDTRGVALPYNNLYIHKAGVKENEVVKKGNEAKTLSTSLQDEKYTITSIVNGELVYTVKNTLNATGITIKGTAELKPATKYDKTYIFDGNDLYTLNEGSTAITLETEKAETFATVSGVTKLLFKNGEYIYYIDSNNKLARIKKDVAGTENKAEELTANAISTSWYSPVVVNNILFYGENSSVKYINLADEKLSEKYITERTGEDKLADFEARINKIGDTLKDGKITEETKTELSAIKEEHNKLTAEDKETIKDAYATLDAYNDAISIAEKCGGLKDIQKLYIDDAKANTTLKTAYETATAEFKKLEEKGQDYFTKVCKLMEGDTYAWYKYARDNVFKA